MSKINTAGRHVAVVKSVEFGKSEKDTPFIQIEFQSEDGSSAITGWLYLSDAAFENTVRTLRDAFKFDGNFETLAEQLNVKPCSITNEAEEYEGKDRIKVKWINAPRTSKPIDNQAEFLKKLTSRAGRIPVKTSKSEPF
jgi:hypothetical protein